MMLKYAIQELVWADKALRIINASRDIKFSLSRVSYIPHSENSLGGLILVHQANSTPLQEAHLTLFLRSGLDESVIIPHFVTHFQCVNMFGTGTRFSVGRIPNGVVNLDLHSCVPVVGSIPSSVKRLLMPICLIDFDPAAIPCTVTDLQLKFLDAQQNDEIRFMFPTSVVRLALGEHNRPFAPGVLPSSLCELDCCSELLSKLEAGAIPDSVRKMSIDWDIRYVPKAGVLPDSVTHIEMTSLDSVDQPIPHWHMPASLTSLVMILFTCSNITVGIVPATVTHFKCTNRFDPGALPNSITHLEICMLDTELVVGIIPRSVTHLNLMQGYSELAILTPGIIPSLVTHLILCCNHQQKMVPGIIPDSVTHLTFEDDFNRPIPEGVISQSVTHLAFGSNFNQPLSSSSLPRSLTHLAFGSMFKVPIGFSVIPPSVKHVMFDGYFSCVNSRDALCSVTHLTIHGSDESDQHLDHSTLPSSLTHLEIPPSYLNNAKLQLPAHVTHLSYQPAHGHKHSEFQSNFWHYELANSH